MQHTLPIAVNQVDVTINQDIKALIIKDKSQLNPYYLAYYFNTFQKRILPLIVKHGTIVQSVNTEQFDKLPIPIPPIEIQKQIVKKFETAYQAKREKEAEAKELLAGIDAYLLDKLGIKPPTTDQPTKKTFFTALSKVTGNRFDAIYYASELFSFLEANKFQLRSLKELCNDLKSGFGAGKQDQSQDEKGLIQIRPTNIGNEGNLKFEKNVYLPIKLLESQQDIFLKEGDVLFNNTNCQELVGKTALFNNQGDFTFSNHITRIRVNEQILPLYLTLILNLYQHRKIFYSICTNWNNQSGVGVDLLKSIQIPLPPLEVQEEIANHIQNIRERAKQLETEAKAEIERAKAEVEAMILGK